MVGIQHGIHDYHSAVVTKEATHAGGYTAAMLEQPVWIAIRHYVIGCMAQKTLYKYVCPNHIFSDEDTIHRKY